MSGLLKTLQSDWPFPAKRLPFFYGWVIALVSTLGFLFSIPGQTMGMAVFADTFIAEFGLTRTQLSFAYLLGTLGSALMLQRTGRWYDLYGARLMIVISAFVLGVTLLFISGIASLADWIHQLSGVSLVFISFPLILVGYFGVRLSGQGVLTSASRNVLLVWFERRRGMVSGIRGVFVSLGFSIAPLLLALMMDALGWQGALWAMAIVVGVGFAVIALLTIRDHPQVSGLAADGGRFDTKTQGHASQAVRPDQTVAQVRGDPVFWVYSAALAMHALFGTAVTFHIVAIFAEAGRDRSEAFGYFLPQAVVSLSVNLLVSTLADHIRLKPVLVAMLAAFLVGAYGLTQLETELGYWMLVTGFGCGGGLWGVLSNLAFIRMYGSLHLGEISGLNTAITVFASAVGPVAFSLAQDYFATFEAAAIACMVGLVSLLVVAVVVRQPHDIQPQLKP
ncbi:MAG: OFA family oxalate/formate antiporter-like MFS transporter [Limisphaerales bacterium]